MNTAKSLQLLDNQYNNISPITNIESIYYEVLDNGVIYRNSLYKHFPIYVKYNNNIDEPIIIRKSSADTGNIIYFKQENNSNYGLGDSSSYRLSQQQTSNDDIFVSSIRQSHLKNTRYYKLDISTYNFSDIMSLYAPKLWVNNKFISLDACIGNIIYDSSIIDAYYEYPPDGLKAYIITSADAGSIEKGTPGTSLNKKRVNDILDQILFKEEYPYLIDVSIHMKETETAGHPFIDTAHLSDFDIENAYSTNLSEVIDVCTGRLRLVYFNNASSMANNNTTDNIINEVVIPDDHIKLSKCREYISNEILPAFFNCFPSRTPNVDYSGNISVWKTFEDNIIFNIKNVLGNYCSEEFLNNTDNWRENYIKLLYSSYPAKNISISNDNNKRETIKSMLTTEIFKDEYYRVCDISVSLKSTQPITNSILQTGDAKYKSNFGNIVGAKGNGIFEPSVYANNVYGSYYIPYNDYFNEYNTQQLYVDPTREYRVQTIVHLAYKCVVNIPIIVNNTVYYVSGVGTKYIECEHNTADDIIIYIPKEIDNSDNVNNNNLPELAYIEQDGVYMKSNGWAIHTRYCNPDEYEGTPYEALQAKFNIYEIKGQKSYDSVSAGTTRKIKIKIETK